MLFLTNLCREKTAGCCDSIMLVCESVDVTDDCCFSGSNCQVWGCHSESGICAWSSEAVPNYWKWCKSEMVDKFSLMLLILMFAFVIEHSVSVWLRFIFLSLSVTFSLTIEDVASCDDAVVVTLVIIFSQYLLEASWRSIELPLFYACDWFASGRESSAEADKTGKIGETAERAAAVAGVTASADFVRQFRRWHDSAGASEWKWRSGW